jgi:integrase
MTELTLAEQIAKTKAELARLEALAKSSRPIRRRLSGKLTVRRIKTTVKAGKDGFFGDGRNLYLRLRDGNATWICRKNRKDYGLGPYPEVGLAETREKRDALLRALADGRDPIAERRNQQQSDKVAGIKRLTFAKATEHFVGVHEAEWKNAKHRTAWLQSLRDYTFPVFGAIDCALIDADLVHKALEPIWQVKTKTASDIRGRIERVLDYAQSVGARPKNQPNPALWRSNLEHRLAKPGKIHRVVHMKAMACADVPALWTQLVADGSLGALALRLTILTGCRPNEVLRAPWVEFKDEKTWVIEAGRMKGGVRHRVPLSDAAIAVRDELRKLPASPLLFASQRKDRLAKPVSAMLMRRTLAKLDYAGKVDVHGFRTTLRGWGKQHGYRREVLELTLAHYEGSKTQKAYDRDEHDLLDERRELLTRWAKFVTEPAPEGKVIPLVRQSA